MTDAATASLPCLSNGMMPHPPEKVWRALTQGPLLEEWLMRNDFQPGWATSSTSEQSRAALEWRGRIASPGGRTEQALSYRWNASGKEAARG